MFYVSLVINLFPTSLFIPTAIKVPRRREVAFGALGTDSLLLDFSNFPPSFTDCSSICSTILFADCLSLLIQHPSFYNSDSFLFLSNYSALFFLISQYLFILTFCLESADSKTVWWLRAISAAIFAESDLWFLSLMFKGTIWSCHLWFLCSPHINTRLLACVS